VLPALDCTGAVIVTDPPYGTGGRRRSAPGAGSTPHGTIVREAWDDGATDWLGLTDAPVLAFWPTCRLLPLLVAAARTGRTKHRALFMHKRDPMPQFGGRMKYAIEPIWALSRPGFVLRNGTEWVTCSTPRAHRDTEAVGHPYQKPVAVMTWLLEKLGAVAIVDPFMGSGSTGVAAIRLDRPFVGIEQDAKWYAVACRRIEAAQRRRDAERRQAGGQADDAA
jgi:hypothetical protein